MFPLLSSRFTACAMDRRGRGGSEDAPEYSLQKEAEDVAAVVDSRPGAVFVLSHSYGAVAALEAAFLTDHIAKLILYEPPVHDPVDRALAVADEIERMIAAGEPEQAIVVFQTEVVEQSPADIAALKTRPAWPVLVATIGLQPRQMRALAGYRFDAERMRAVDMPTLLLIGGDTTSPSMKQAINSLQAALPNPTVTVLEGQEHNAMDTARETLAAAIIGFAASGSTTH